MADFLLYRAQGPTDAYQLRAYLASRGIACTVKGEALMGLMGGIPAPDAWPTVWVEAEAEEAAREVLARWQGPALVHPAWRCPSCGEDNPASFELCWNCEGPRG